MNRNKLMYYKNKLMEEKNNLEKSLKRLNDEEKKSFKDSTGDLSSYDNHPADQGSETFEREMDLGLADNIKGSLKEIADALKRIKTGEYGICQSCGKKISEDRLNVIPYTNFCEVCKAKEEEFNSARNRPMEEELIKHPFGRGFNDNKDIAIYDAEDTWQDVARHGTSNTPSDISENNIERLEEAYIDSKENNSGVEMEDFIYNDEIDDLKDGEDEETSFTGRKGK
jgi:YteA family regulatory protein